MQCAVPVPPRTTSPLSYPPTCADTDLDSKEILQDAEEEAEGELTPGKQTIVCRLPAYL